MPNEIKKKKQLKNVSKSRENNVLHTIHSYVTVIQTRVYSWFS